jgi:hypothetical protein
MVLKEQNTKGVTAWANIKYLRNHCDYPTSLYQTDMNCVISLKIKQSSQFGKKCVYIHLTRHDTIL